jgi:integrase
MARKVLASLKSIITEAQRRGLVARYAALPVKIDIRKRETGKLTVGRDIPSKDEVQAILATAAGRWRPLFVTAIFTGMRASELRSLTWDDVDFKKEVVHVRQRANLWGDIGAPKSAAGDREIPMAPVVVNTLREWKLACPKGELGIVFPNGKGKIEATPTSGTGASRRYRSRPGSSARTASRSMGCTRYGTSLRHGRSNAVFRL